MNDTKPHAAGGVIAYERSPVDVVYDPADRNIHAVKPRIGPGYPSLGYPSRTLCERVEVTGPFVDVPAQPVTCIECRTIALIEAVGTELRHRAAERLPRPVALLLGQEAVAVLTRSTTWFHLAGHLPGPGMLFGVPIHGYEPDPGITPVPPGGWRLVERLGRQLAAGVV